MLDPADLYHIILLDTASDQALIPREMCLHARNQLTRAENGFVM